MKTQIDIITGFLGSGKTTYINGTIENTKPPRERTVIIQCEIGEEEIDSEILNSEYIYIERLDRDKALDVLFIEEIIKKYSPHRMIIEYNGTARVEDLLDVLDQHPVRKLCVINRIVHTIDVSTFEVFMKNMGSILIEQISNSDLVVLNKSRGFTREKLKSIEKTIKALNKTAEVVRAVIMDDSDEVAVSSEVSGGEGLVFSRTLDKFAGTFLVLVLAYLVFIVFKGDGFNLSSIDMSKIAVFNTVFQSILMQAFPFMFVGVFISSILQVFVSEDTITKVFPKNKFIAFLISIVAGVFLPVCDCAIVPIAGRLVKKGVPLYCAVTFMLAAPVVDPVVVASTFYAFPGSPQIAVYRVVIGIVIAAAVGITLLLFGEEGNVLLNNVNSSLCNCGYCSSNNRNKRIKDRIGMIFQHAGAEFFEVGKFLIIGAFLSVIVQTALPREILAGISAEGIGSLLVMMGAAFILSICSTSDAFIARSFSSLFPMSSVMGFMVMGAMIDIKNVLMLLGTFKKRFVVKLLLIILALSFSIISFFTILLF
ncbi:MAG: permease [Bacillota bacterium]